ncbi:MAG TPA: prolyl oligopeptidase family serine peptidase [Casimicrobiaceae bacterium]|nr:prolyl oligopeptidase family serine peptidase [Casimicrobiaceae bacterium]
MAVMKARIPIACIAAALASGTSLAQPAPQYPATPKRPVEEVHHGVKVVDDYRWLEDAGAPDVQTWIAAQNQAARAYLDAIPGRARIARQVETLLRMRATRRYDFILRGGQLFAMRNVPPANQPQLVVMGADGRSARERVVVDPLAIDPKGRTAIDLFRPSYDGRHVVVSLSENGSEDGTAYVYDVATGKRLPDVVPGVNYPTAGGSFEWSPDGDGFYYTRYPREGERPPADRHFYQTVWFHALGTPASEDRYVIGRDFPRIAEIKLRGSRDGRYLLAAVGNGDGGDTAFWLRDDAGQWTQVASFADGVKAIEFADDDRLYALSVKDAPLRRVLAMPAAKPVLAEAVVVVPQGELPIEAAVPAKTRLYVRYLDGGPSRIRIYTLDGNPLRELPAKALANVSIGGRLAGDDILVAATSYTTPPTWSRYEAARDRLVATRLDDRPTVSLADAVVEREFALSKDGTKVPVVIVHRKDTRLDGSNPVLLNAYGGYGISMRPRFDPLLRLWLDYGGVYAVASLRGGGEYGEPWHEAGKLTRKQNVFDDFAAVMRHLVERKYTTPARLAITGRSNGGLTMGAALTQQPQAMRAVVSGVGIYDTMRWEAQPNGEYNTTEFGSIRDPAQFKALYDYSPLLRVRDGVAYPAVLLTTGENDGRVAPYESRKMAARLQAATSSSNPVLLVTQTGAGHGIGTSLDLRIAGRTDEYAFLVDQLGMKAVDVDRAKAQPKRR